MSPQTIELLIFAVIAFLLINKLLSVLGTTNVDENVRNSEKSYFGEKLILKDVTALDDVLTVAQSSQDDIKDLIVDTNIDSVMQNYMVLKNKMPDFDLVQFLSNTKVVFKMLIEAMVENNSEAINYLVDKRYIKQSADILSKYGSYKDNGILNAKISELYMFGNNAFVKVLFSGKDIVSAINNISEEWTFSRNTNSQSLTWYLSNIESV